MAGEQGLSKAKSFKDTLNLPRTEFPIRSNPQVDDLVMIERWERERLYRTAYHLHEGQEKFILHDGPPYANGHIHIGHAYNKILKDIVTKSQRMLGKHVPVTPGWDCHGLPIEHKVSAEHKGASLIELKKACRAYAQKWVNIQRQEFKRLGVVMDWDHPYSTMDPSYEAAILQSLGAFVAAGYIERKNKTVPWCPSCQTALAMSAEIEYHERKDPSLYVLFRLDKSTTAILFPQIMQEELNFVIWTTTPWTLPLNRAVLVRPDTKYVVVRVGTTYIIVAAELAEKVAYLAEAPWEIVATCTSTALTNAKAQAHHPLLPDYVVPVIADGSVSVEEGTACVHSAPGCGPEDYEVGLKNNLEIFSPLTPDGKYAPGIMPQQLEGMSVADGQLWVIKELVARGRLFHKTSIRHAYPHCWRCRQGLIFRATRQWFCNLAKDELKQKTLTAIDTLHFVPEKAKNSLRATISGRLEWCLSRQRAWGVPITALLCSTCDYAYITQALIELVATQVKQQGIEYWDKVSIQELLPSGFACPLCNRKEFVKERDILDVWFDSGISHTAVLTERTELHFPADLYLEGKDQHRGWFQSSLLTSMVLHGVAPMQTILAHGYTVDAQGRKMSKSLGNGVEPQTLLEQLGTDGVRLWAASIDCASEAVISEALLTNVKEVLRKIRNTCRFMLSNIYDFEYERDALAYEDLFELDRHAIQTFHELNMQVMAHYQAFDFTSVVHTLTDYCTVTLSALYLDIVKDRLYTEVAQGRARRSAQTACWYILDGLTKLMAPIMSFTAEQLSDQYQKNKTISIHLQCFAQTENVWCFSAPATTVITGALTGCVTELMHDQIYKQQWCLLQGVRDAVLKALEGLREQGVIKHSLESRVSVHFDLHSLGAQLEPLFERVEQSGQERASFLKEYFIVSQVVIAPREHELARSSLLGLALHVEHAQGDKCPRCWQWEITNQVDKLCARCAAIVLAL